MYSTEWEDFKWKSRQWQDRLIWWLTNRIPRGVCHMAAIRMWAECTTHKLQNVPAPDVTVSDMLQAWEEEGRKQ